MTSLESASAGADPILAVDDLHVCYGRSIEAVRGLTLEVARGSVVSLIGANGAGKTSTVRAITGLLTPHGGSIDRGDIRYDGASIIGTSTTRLVKHGIGQVLEGRHIFPDLTVGENLRAGGYTCRDRRTLEKRYQGVLERFDSLARRERTAAGYLSGGEQQMLAIGRALMQSPKLLLLDEPSLGLAPVIVAEVRRMILELNRTGTTILLIEQNVAMALEVSDRAYVLERGRVIRSGNAAELMADDSIRRSYLGIEVGSPS